MEVKRACRLPAGRPALDVFRPVAAALVVAVHTSPLASVSPLGDFVFTRVLARLAVPFFFMAAGHFFPAGEKPLQRFLAKILRLYGLAIVLYLPLNVYMGDFGGEGFALRLVKDLVWNGTVYHLWYLPAVALGGAIAWGCYRLLPPAGGFGLCGLLYVVGVGGDSWYVLLQKAPALRGMYEGLFGLFDYTRNGLLFAPLFVLGGLWLRQARRLPRRWASGAAFAVALGGMLAEALWLRGLGPLRHDSMYLLLPLCAGSLFVLLASVRGAARPLARGIAGPVYIVHLWCIVGVRAVAKLAGAWLVALNPVFYLAVLGSSFGLAALWLWLRGRGPGRGRRGFARAVCQRDPEALVHNLRLIEGTLAEGSEVMAVLKRDAYGHGAVWAARLLRRQGVRAFAVATLAEGIQLRRAGVFGRILVLGYTPPEEAARLRRWRLMQTVVDAEHAAALSGAGRRLEVHIKIDTGMHRLGVPAEDFEAVCGIYRLPGLRVRGIYTHLARAGSGGEADRRFTAGQVRIWYALLERLMAQGLDVGKTHLQSSYGAAAMPGLPCDYVRIGLGLFGVAESPAKPLDFGAPLRPVMALRARVASVRRVPAGGWVGYGRAHQCSRETLVATLAIGYGDGVPRAWRGRVLLRGRACPVLGRVCMDMLCVDASAVPGLRGGEVATLIGRDGGAEIDAAEMAARCGSIANELLCGISPRCPREGMRRDMRGETCYNRGKATERMVPHENLGDGKGQTAWRQDAGGGENARVYPAL